LAARRALLRLRDLAVGGLLQGVWAHEYPATAVQREQFAAALARLNPAPLTLEAAPRAGALAAIADELADNPQAQHMAGVAALLAGNVIAGREYLTRAEKIAPAPITRLALAEAYRRAGNPTAAETALAQAAASLPGALKPEHALLTARLSAARGDLGGAAATLEAALKTWPEHAALRAYCESARSLTRPAALAPAPRAGPLGLRVLSDLTDKQLAVLTARLEPYLEKFRVWLPNLARQLAGTLVIYNGPEDYLNAALLVAGDQLDNVAGMYLPAGIEGKPTVLACRGFGEDELLRTLVHELWHLAFATTPGGKDAPRWLNEGMAVYLSAGRVDRGAMNYDRLPEEFADGLDLCPESLRRALAAKGADFYVPAAIRANYAAGWAVVWHLASGDNVSLLRRLLAGDSEPLAGLAAGLDRLAPELGRRVAGLKKGS
ncbi:MAG: DUF1570 domain-containing protein, partial [Planctomycetes bacterium]|nr:DUF1570 domain-containing protein [Planctomycetota bacterium]